MRSKNRSAVLSVSGLHWASSAAVVEAVLSRRDGVHSVEANPVDQTATVTYDPGRTTVAQLAGWVRDCGYHCAGQSVPSHLCDPMGEPTDHGGAGTRAAHDMSATDATHVGHAAHAGHDEHAGHAAHAGHDEHAG